MFYASLFLSKRGPLAKIWLAAHWDKKLTKAHVFECNLEATIESIISPKIKIALRTSGHLLLGVVRIYNRKAKYLLADCNEAFTKIKVAFRPDIVDLDEENLEATYNAITLPEEFHDFSILLPDVDAIDVGEHFTLNQSTSDAITLKENMCSILQDNGFGDGYGMLGNIGILDDNVISTSESLLPQTPENNSGTSMKGFMLSYDKNSFQNDGFGDEGAACMLEELLSGEAEDPFVDFTDTSSSNIKDLANLKLQTVKAGDSDVPGPLLQMASAVGDETTLLCNEEECFTLQPIDTTVSSERRRGKRRRKLIVDCIKELDSKTIRDQIEDFSDIITTIELAPPTKKLMIWKETGGVDKLNTLPAQHLINYRLLKLFRRCLRKCLPWEKNNQNDALEGTYDTEQTRSEEHDAIGFDKDLHNVEEPCDLQDSLITESRRSSIGHRPVSVQKVCKDHDSLSEKEIYDLRIHLKTGEKFFSIQELCRNNNRKQAATKFYSFLMLKKQLVLELSQKEPYSDIVATPGELFNR
ncbi:double-strand-break repair protein rad21 homolog [Hemitrygon akajei]|uniref:double-strand-break repair protein rad21 homolog n=1 Tax=Hemitrygon akajei TaxID=2704970 RepID=UPI003BF9D2B3